MPYETVPLPFKPNALDGLSEHLLVSHYENNYGGAVRRLNAINVQLAALDCPATAVFKINGLGRERLVAANSMVLPEIYLAGLGEACVRDCGAVDRWRAEFAAMGRAGGGGAGWVLVSWSERLGRLVNQW